METIRFCEMVAPTYQNVRQHIPGERHFNIHRSDNVGEPTTDRLR